MVYFRQVSAGATRAACIALVLSIAIGGAPAFGGMTCTTSDAHCRERLAPSDCADNALVMSCVCNSQDQPANPSSSGATDLVTPAAHQGSRPFARHEPSAAALSRPDYSIARGRHFTALPILHASLLI